MTVDAHIRSRLENFGKYWRDYGGDFKRCRSLEHRYITHRHLDSRIEAEAEQERIAARPPAPDMRDALVVHDAWRKCSKETKRVLKWSFCMGRVSDQTICNRCGIQPQALNLRFARACLEIATRLDNPIFADRIAPNNSRISHPAPTENLTALGAVRSTAKETEDVD